MSSDDFVYRVRDHRTKFGSSLSAAVNAVRAGWPHSEIMHRREMTAADLIECARANAERMGESSNIGDLLSDLAGRLEARENDPCGVR